MPVFLSVTDFCARVSNTLTNASFEQKRALVELLIDRVVVFNEEVEIRYVIPLSSKGERTRFCQLRSDYRTDVLMALAACPDVRRGPRL